MPPSHYYAAVIACWAASMFLLTIARYSTRDRDALLFALAGFALFFTALVGALNYDGWMR